MRPFVAGWLKRRASVALLTVLIGGIGSVAHAQTATYHLHKDVSSFNAAFDQLNTANPDAASFAIASVDLKNLLPAEALVKRFDTQASVFVWPVVVVLAVLVARRATRILRRRRPVLAA